MNTKQCLYDALVEKRRACRLCQDLNVVRLADCWPDEYGSQHLGPWTEWQGNLDAELMVIGQDWGGTSNYLKQSGCDIDGDDTNANLVKLLGSIDLDIQAPSEHQRKKPKAPGILYFTNAVLCLRQGNATDSTKDGGKEPASQCFRNCARQFLKPQIEVVRPRAVVALGFEALRAILRSYDLRLPRSLTSAVEAGPISIGAMSIVPVFHCGAISTNMNRSLDDQKQDWQSVKRALQS
jgi:DNA polymerase